ncbi:hypothetical protein Zmor_009712 [Zophobas morio]|uniref:Uncharacterized protein n=1 Tax=Zophobas morio TaxID=2755281 RepID=A0AA38MIU0_9CUCU|nr:hypothetical protein Zmor_009712 [Zophobas morio]
MEVRRAGPFGRKGPPRRYRVARSTKSERTWGRKKKRKRLSQPGREPLNVFSSKISRRPRRAPRPPLANATTRGVEQSTRNPHPWSLPVSNRPSFITHHNSLKVRRLAST